MSKKLSSSIINLNDNPYNSDAKSAKIDKPKLPLRRADTKNSVSLN